MAGGQTPKPVAQDEWVNVQPDEWQTVGANPASSDPSSDDSFVGTLSGTAPWQRAIDDAAMSPSFKPHASMAENAGTVAGKVGAGLTRVMLEPVAHLLDTISGLGSFVSHPIDSASRFSHQVMSDPITGLTSMMAGETLGAPGMKRTSEIGPYRSPVIPGSEAAAERLMQAISPPEGLTPTNVRAAMRETPLVREYAQRTGNPLRTIPEGMKAAQGVAEEGLNHYKAHFLDPNADIQENLPNNMSPELGNVATLRQIDQRISDINDLIRGAERTAKSTGQEMTAQERLGLDNEAKNLRAKLYQALSERTGVSPEDIQGLREGYGGQFAIKNALESGHYQRLTQTGRMSQGTGTTMPFNKTDAAGRFVTWLRGGPERIANRQFRSRIQAFEPEAPSYPFPKPQMRSEGLPEQMSPQLEHMLNVRGSSGGVSSSMAEPPLNLNGPMRKAPAVEEAERVSDQFRAERNNDFARSQREAKESDERKALANELTKGKRLNILAQKKGLK